MIVNGCVQMYNIEPEFRGSSPDGSEPDKISHLACLERRPIFEVSCEKFEQNQPNLGRQAWKKLARAFEK